MDIYSFIRSRDVGEHCRKINKTWNTHDMAVIISRSNRSLEEKYKAWQELIDSYPDMPAPPNVHNTKYDSIHKKLSEIMEFDHLMLERFILPEPNCYYTLSVWQSDSNDMICSSYDMVFSSYERAMCVAKEDWERDEICRIVITMRFIDCDEARITAEYNYDDQLLDLYFEGSDKLRTKWFPGYENLESRDVLSTYFYIDIPTPFKRGDILTYPPYNMRFSSSRIFVLDRPTQDPRYHERALRGECSDGSDLVTWGLFVSDDGVLYGDHTCEYDCFEYFDGKLEENDQLLHYVNLFINDKIDLPAMLNVQCRIIAEHQLKNNYRIDSHGACIPEELLAKNRESCK